MTRKVLPRLPESTDAGREGRPWEWAQEFSMNLFFLQIKVLIAQALWKCYLTPPLLPVPPHSFLGCWQSHTVTSHLPSGPLPWALPGPEGAVQGLRLCAGCRTWGTLGISLPLHPLWAALVPLLLPTVKCLKCNAPPSLAEGRLPWHWGTPDRASGPL